MAGTVHVRDNEFRCLRRIINIPPTVVEATRKIPKGKGMAGLAWSRNKPVQTCNLKDDKSGDVRPGAKAVDAKAAVDMPVYSIDGTLRAVVGLAFMFERDFNEVELADLTRAASALPER